MKENRCLYCYQPLPAGAIDFHEKCSLKFFGTPNPPTLEYRSEQMQKLAEEIVIRSIAVTGVQPKISLTIESQPGDPKRSRFTIVGLWGNFILKPPTKEFPYLPENEDLTMHLGALFGIETADHSLLRLQSGELAYITKRFDRVNGDKLALEDMCQLTETLTIDKYRSSMEKIGKQIAQFSTRPGLDLIAFFEIALFSFLTGNADMHLKNFSLLTTSNNDIILSPAYDMLCTKLAMPEDKEEMALTLNGRKRRIKRSDFDAFGRNLKISEKTTINSYQRFSKKLNDALAFIDISFLKGPQKTEYKNTINEAAETIGLLK
jgi:serine/threonine-protein kinase HipA